MAFDERLAQRVRGFLAERADAVERKMFGGLAFMVNGHMCCGVVAEDLMVRTGPDAYERALGEKHAREMDFTGRPLRGMVYVAPAGTASDRQLAGWLERGLAFVNSLPPK